MGLQFSKPSGITGEELTEEESAAFVLDVNAPSPSVVSFFSGASKFNLAHSLTENSQQESFVIVDNDASVIFDTTGTADTATTTTTTTTMANIPVHGHGDDINQNNDDNDNNNSDKTVNGIINVNELMNLENTSSTTIFLADDVNINQAIKKKSMAKKKSARKPRAKTEAVNGKKRDTLKKKHGPNNLKFKRPKTRRTAPLAFTQPLKLSPELAAFVGAEMMSRPMIVKRIWSIVRSRNLFDPKNKQFAFCDDEMYQIFGIKRIRMFAMMKYLNNHLSK